MGVDAEDAEELVRSSWSRRKILVALAIAVGVVVGVALIIESGLVGRLSDQEELQRTVEDAGAWAPLLFLGLMIVLVPLNVPGIIFVIPATTIFGTVTGVVLSLIGGFVASSIGIVAARRLGRSAFETRMPPRLKRLETRMARGGLWGVAIARCFAFLFQPLDWLCGLSSLPMRTVLVGTFIGLIPPTLAIALSGGGLIDLIL